MPGAKWWRWSVRSSCQWDGLRCGAHHVIVPVSVQLLASIAVTTACWVATAFLAPATERSVLISFYSRVRPFGRGLASDPARGRLGRCGGRGAHTGDNFPLALLGWVAGCTTIWSSLFVVGNFLYGRMGYAIGLFVVFLISGTVLCVITRTLWNAKPAPFRSLPPTKLPPIRRPSPFEIHLRIEACEHSQPSPSCVLCVSIARAAEEPKVVKYTTFEGKAVELHPWRGKRVVLLTMRGDLDPAVMQKITDTLMAFTIITSKPPA